MGWHRAGGLALNGDALPLVALSAKRKILSDDDRFFFFSFLTCSHVLDTDASIKEINRRPVDKKMRKESSRRRT